MIDTIFVPRGAEERAVRRALVRANSPLRVVTTGIGPHAAGLAAQDALAGPTIDRALVTGLCGLLAAAFAVGDSLVYGELVRDAARPVRLDRELSARVAERLADVQTGIRAVAAEGVVTSAREKALLGDRYGAQAVDMESLPLVEHLQRAGIAVAVVRIASDGVADDLPDLHMALDGSGGLDGFALALAMLRRPIAGARLARNGARALSALQAAVGAIVRA